MTMPQTEEECRALPLEAALALAEKTAQRANEAKVSRPCPMALVGVEQHWPFYLPYDHALIPGHVYSEMGLREMQRISGSCEWCFDKAFADPEDDDDDDV
jgi:hypothetical protein